MAAQVTLDDLLVAHEGISATIMRFYPYIHDVEFVGATEESNTKVTNEVSSFLDAVSVLEDVREQLTYTLEQASAATLSQASASLTHPQVLGERLSWCIEAEQHMRSVIESKDLLIYHLQQPLIATFLTMHHKHHRSLVSLVGALSDLLNRLHQHTSLLERYAAHSSIDSADSVISSLTRAVATQREVLSDVSALQTIVASVLDSGT